MSAAEEDTELRDLLIHTLEDNGVLSRIKAELRASVFLALEEHDKSGLVNESLRHFLSTAEGRLVTALITDFLQHFHLDFTMAVLQPEASLTTTQHDRAQIEAQLGLPGDCKGGPLLLELVRHCQHTQRTSNGLHGLAQEPRRMAEEPRRMAGAQPMFSFYDQDKSAEMSREEPRRMSEDPRQMAEAQAKFSLYDHDKSGQISRESLRQLFVDLFPSLHRDMLDRYVSEETKAADKPLSSGVDLQEFLAMYRRLLVQCKSMPAQQVSDLIQPSTKLTSRSDSSSYSKSLDKHPSGAPQLDDLHPGHQDSERSKLDKDDSEGDSFFDDPIPKAEKTYGWKEESSKPNGSLSGLLHSPADKSEASSHSEAPNEASPRSHLKSASEKMASLELGAANDDDYADDFNSTSQRSDKSEVSIGEDLEEDLSVDDFTGSDHKLEDFTLDNSISHLSDVADYLEDVS